MTGYLNSEIIDETLLAHKLKLQLELYFFPHPSFPEKLMHKSIN